MRKVTIKDVAKMAEVSASTVSRVLSGSTAISEDTCKRVREAAEKLGYIPNTAARSLRCDRSRSIGVVLPDISGEFYSLCASSILKYARRIGHTVLFIESGRELDAESEGIRILLQHGVDGMIFIGGGIDGPLIQEASRNVPIVTGDRSLENVPSVTFNNRETVRKLTQALYDSGYRKFLYLGESFNGFSNLSERYAGFTDTLSRYSDITMITMLEDVLHGDKLSASFSLFKNKIKDIMPEVIITSNDLIAQGIISASFKCGISIPDQIAVTGFDDMVSSAYYTPSVTTVRQDADELSRICFDNLIKMINDEPVSSSEIEQKIIVRESAQIKGVI